MRFYTFACVLVILCVSIVYAQGQGAGTNSEDVGRAWHNYTLKVTEVQLKPEFKLDVAATDLPQKWSALEREGKIGLVETVTLSVLEGNDVKTQFGKRTSVVIGRTGQSQVSNGSAVTRDIQVGTVVRANAKAQDSKILVKFTYEASRLVDNAKSEFGQPDTVESTIEATYLLEPGKPILASGSNARSGAYVILSIE